MHDRGCPGSSGQVVGRRFGVIYHELVYTGYIILRVISTAGYRLSIFQPGRTLEFNTESLASQLWPFAFLELGSASEITFLSTHPTTTAFVPKFQHQDHGPALPVNAWTRISLSLDIVGSSQGCLA